MSIRNAATGVNRDTIRRSMGLEARIIHVRPARYPGFSLLCCKCAGPKMRRPEHPFAIDRPGPRCGGR